MKTHHKTVRSEIYRNPSHREKELGLWVDRIGSSIQRVRTPLQGDFRVLGLFAVVAVEDGGGVLANEHVGPLSLQSGDAFIVFPDIGYSYKPAGEWNCHWIVWSGYYGKQLVELLNLSPLDPVIQNSASIVRQKYNRLKALASLEDATGDLERSLLLQQLLLELKNAASPAIRRATKENRLDQVRKYLIDHSTADLSLKALAQKFGFSESNLRRRFKEQYGQSPKQFILNHRMLRAKEHLSEGKSIKEVAHLVGYQDVCYFMRIFRKVTGITAKRFYQSLD